MSTKDEKDVSGFTVDTLHVHLDRQMLDLKAKLDERHHAQTTAMQTAFAASEKAVDKRQDTADKEFHEHLQQVRHENSLAFINAEKAIDRALAAQKESIAKSEARYDARFVDSNHIREQLSDQAATFMPRSESLAKHEATAEKLDAQVKSVSDQLGEIRLQMTEQAVRTMPRTEAETHTAATMDRLREVEIRMQSYPSRDETALALTAADAKSAAALATSMEKHEQAGSRIAALELRLTSRLDFSNGRSTGYASVYGWAVAGIGLLVTVIVLANSVFGK